MSTKFGQFDVALVRGLAYRVSTRHTLADGEQLIIHFDAPADGSPLYIATPAIDPAAKAHIDVYENADPGTSTVDDLFVHNMRYDVDAAEETPDSTIVRVSDGGLDTTAADQTEQSLIRSGSEYLTPGDEEQRGLWRIISSGETATMAITDRSNGSGNEYGFDTVVYEGTNWK